MRPHLERLPHEEFWVMLLSQSGTVIREANVSRGGVTATVVDVRIILKHAIESYASAIIVFHNHPSGQLNPSPQDDALTLKIADACRLMDIRLNDHIIITDAAYYSYRDHSRL